MSAASDYAENKILEHLTGKTAWTKPTNTYLKLHTGAPGEAGTANAATETLRKVTAWAAASGGSIATNADIVWTGVTATETYTHWSLWDAVTAGNCLAVGAFGSGISVTSGGNFTINSGGLILTQA